MADLFGGALPVPLASQIAEVEREIKQRERVYPRWVEAGKMPKATAEAMDHPVAVPMPTCPNCGPDAARHLLPCASRVPGECAMDGPRRGPPGGGMVRRRDFYGRVWIWMGWRWRTVTRSPANPAREGQ